MTTGSTKELLPLTERPAWQALEAHCREIRGRHLRSLFADDATRGERLTAEAGGIFLDYSKNHVTDETIALLCRLAEASGLRDRIDAMFGGARINVTENRAVLHVALRAPRGTSIIVDGKNVAIRLMSTNTFGRALFCTSTRSASTGAPTPRSQQVLVGDVANRGFSDHLRQVVLDEGIRALAFIPVIYQGRLLGKFMLYFDQPHHFEDEEVRIARTIAGHIAFALARANTAEELASSRDELAIILRDVADGITVQNPDGSIVYANPAAARLIGYASVDDLLATTSRSRAPLRTVRRDGRAVPPDRLPAVALQGGRPDDVICRFRRLPPARSAGPSSRRRRCSRRAAGSGRRSTSSWTSPSTAGRRGPRRGSRRSSSLPTTPSSAKIRRDDPELERRRRAPVRLHRRRGDRSVDRDADAAGAPDELPSIMERLRRNRASTTSSRCGSARTAGAVDVSVSISPIRDTRARSPARRPSPAMSRSTSTLSGFGAS